MSNDLKMDIAKAFSPVKRRGKGFAKAIRRGDPFKLFTPAWMFFFSLSTFLMKLLYISFKKVWGGYV